LLTGAGSGGGGGGSGNILHGIASADIHPLSAGNVTTLSGTVSATNVGGVQIFTGESCSVFQESSLWYAIPSATDIYTTTCPTGVDAQGSVSIVLPDGRTVTATNYSRSKCFANFQIHVYYDKYDQEWKIIRTDDFHKRHIIAQIDAAYAMYPADATITVRMAQRWTATMPRLFFRLRAGQLAGEHEQIRVGRRQLPRLAQRFCRPRPVKIDGQLDFGLR